MSKTVTLRLSDKEYEQIAMQAEKEHRPISNLITHLVIGKIEESFYADPVEMDQIRSDAKLLAKLQRGHKEAKKLKGRSR